MLLGLRNIVSSKEDWHYLIFYDIDRDITEHEKDMIEALFTVRKLSYMLYKTVNGYHIICLTPVNAFMWSEVFVALKQHFHSYYSGNVIRVSRKKDEVQKLVAINTTNGEVIPNLYNIYATRFSYEKMNWVRVTSKYLLVFDKYRTVKGENNE